MRNIICEMHRKIYDCRRLKSKADRKLSSVRDARAMCQLYLATDDRRWHLKFKKNYWEDHSAFENINTNFP